MLARWGPVFSHHEERALVLGLVTLPGKTYTPDNIKRGLAEFQGIHRRTGMVFGNQEHFTRMMMQFSRAGLGEIKRQGKDTLFSPGGDDISLARAFAGHILEWSSRYPEIHTPIALNAVLDPAGLRPDRNKLLMYDWGDGNYPDDALKDLAVKVSALIQADHKNIVKGQGFLQELKKPVNSGLVKNLLVKAREEASEVDRISVRRAIKRVLGTSAGMIPSEISAKLENEGRGVFIRPDSIYTILRKMEGEGQVRRDHNHFWQLIQDPHQDSEIFTVFSRNNP
ncbi:MAG: hypothetical protein UT63_C0061G0005 [Candidatus Gottesmanbacteria bacterium GW2011_GWC2_39_8]|uniref:Uncharacterized protein n=1 Tax=Candidatus Gottesmanbacteria bacterium GW2011_GWC2_39_8 TaxID=1618450 RepID=A0A0G0SAH9_9BACT|nr:MAG: hypothetical protein UT63_C0061G0005 [Candidatus Gottesmanbacteria bacterium GW2011_GWC2_39_8]